MVRHLKLVIIGGQGRSGGTLFLRLLDGNPKLSCHHAFYRFLNWRDGGFDYYDWPHLKRMRNRPDFISAYFNLSKQIISINPKTGAINKGGMEKFKAGTTEGEFRRFLKERLKPYGGYLDLRNYLDVLNQCLAEKFCTDYRDTDYFVGHWADGIFMDIDRYFATYPDGFFIHTLRDLNSTLASMKIRAMKANNRFNAGEIIKYWLSGCDIALKNLRLYPQHYILVFHKPLILNTKYEIKRICGILKVDIHENCDKPTYRDQYWGDHMSSYNSKNNLNGNIDKGHLGAWKEILSEDEKKMCEKYNKFFHFVFDAENSDTATKFFEKVKKEDLPPDPVTGAYRWMDFYRGKKIRPAEIVPDDGKFDLDSLIKNGIKRAVSRVFLF